MIWTPARKLHVSGQVSDLFGGRFVETPGRILSAAGPPVAGYVAWYDASKLDAFTLSGTTITVWHDRTGSFDAIPAGGTVSYDDTSHPDFPVASFPSSGENSLKSDCDARNVRPSSSFLVCSITSLANHRSLLAPQAGGGNVLRVNTDDRLHTIKSSISDLASDGAHAVPVGSATVLGQVIDATTITHYVDGDSETDSNSTAFSSSAKLDIGADRPPTGTAPMYGWIGEIVIYDFALTPTEALEVTDYLTAKWL